MAEYAHRATERGAELVVFPEALLGMATRVRRAFGTVDARKGPLTDSDGLVSDLDLESVARGRYDLHAAGHHSRPTCLP